VIPFDDPLFRAAVRNGIEIGDDGKLYGLLWVDRSCGNDPFIWRRRRIDLSALSAALLPDAIDKTLVAPEAVQFLSENHRLEPRASRLDRLNDYSMAQVSRFQRELDFALAQWCGAGVPPAITKTRDLFLAGETPAHECRNNSAAADCPLGCGRWHCL
jgi:hypothetical protein